MIELNELLTNDILKTFSSIFPSDASIAIADSDSYIYYKPSPFINLNIKPGDRVKKGSSTYQALRTGQKVFTFIDSSVFGISYYGLSVPVKSENIVNGCFTVIFPQKSNVTTPSFLTIKQQDRYIPVSLQEIYYLEAENRKAKIVAKNAIGFHKYNLSDLEPLLPSENFFRCHRSFIVNINEIAEIQPDFHSTFLLIMKNGDRVPVSQSFASNFRRTLMF